MLTQALGTGKKLEPEIVDFQLSVGDVVLLCSDGFYNEVSESYIKRKLSEGIQSQRCDNKPYVLAQLLICIGTGP